MNKLLQLAIEAHGGLGRWERVKTIDVKASITGGIWWVKGRPDVLKDVVLRAETREERVEMDFVGQDKKTVFEPARITVDEGRAVRTYENPIREFAGHVRETPWEDVHVAYFSGEALWTYLTTPFLYNYPGFEVEEMEPWSEAGEVWRRLRVLFPSTIKSHTREQVSYFGPDGLLRRHDYTVDILGGATGANYATN